jgi:hypothetical protein
LEKEEAEWITKLQQTSQFSEAARADLEYALNHFDVEKAH